jgi:regulator of protease activity HflC (stomatin/prohibitin superfamily)
MFLQWLNDLVYFFAKFFPHILIVRSTHGGVRFRRGNPILIEGGKVIVYWPIVTQVVILPLRRQTNELALQILTTHDGRTVAVGGIVIYQVSDVFKAVVNAWNIYRVVDDTAQMILANLIPNHVYEDIQKDLDEFNGIFEREITPKLAEYGIEVEEAGLMNFAECFAFRNIGDVGSWNPTHTDVE